MAGRTNSGSASCHRRANSRHVARRAGGRDARWPVPSLPGTSRQVPSLTVGTGVRPKPHRGKSAVKFPHRKKNQPSSSSTQKRGGQPPVPVLTRISMELTRRITTAPCGTTWVMQNCAGRGPAVLDAYKQGDERGCTAEDILAMGISTVKFQHSAPCEAPCSGCMATWTARGDSAH